MRKTYGVAGYMEWIAVIRVGSARVRVPFTGGALNAYGVTPAEYTTDSAFMQAVVEGSTYFADGRIKLLSAVDDEPAAVESGHGEQAGEAEPAQEPAQGALPAEAVAVACLQDAQAELAERYGVPSVKVRTRAAADRVAAEHGLAFDWGAS